MFVRVASLIIGSGVCAIGVLVIRQAQYQAAHDLAKARLRTIQAEEQLARLRARLARLTHPDRIELMASKLTPLSPALPFELPTQPTTDSSGQGL